MSYSQYDLNRVQTGTLLSTTVTVYPAMTLLLCTVACVKNDKEWKPRVTMMQYFKCHLEVRLQEKEQE